MEPFATKLVAHAREAAKHAHAPYSKFFVGAALLTAEGEIITGFNIENVSYGLTLCAERAAMVHALCRGHKKFAAVAVCAGSAENPATPCGACRQFLAEFLAPETPVFFAGLPEGSRVERTTVGGLLPMGFQMDAPPLFSENIQLPISNS